MSDLQNQLAAIDTIYNTTMKNLKFDVAELAFRIVKNPEIAHQITLEEGENIVTCAFQDIGNFQTLVRNTIVAIQQRGN